MRFFDSFKGMKQVDAFMLGLDDFLCDMTDIREAYYRKQFSQSSDPLTYSIGLKFVKVFLLSRETGEPDSVWCFIDVKGDIFKPASWAKPAKHARGNIFIPDSLANIGPYGPQYLKKG